MSTKKFPIIKGKVSSQFLFAILEDFIEHQKKYTVVKGHYGLRQWTAGASFTLRCEPDEYSIDDPWVGYDTSYCTDGTIDRRYYSLRASIEPEAFKARLLYFLKINKVEVLNDH